MAVSRQNDKMTKEFLFPHRVLHTLPTQGPNIKSCYFYNSMKITVLSVIFSLKTMCPDKYTKYFNQNYMLCVYKLYMHDKTMLYLFQYPQNPRCL